MEGLNTTVRSVAFLLSTTAGVGSRTGVNLPTWQSLALASSRGEGEDWELRQPRRGHYKTLDEQGQSPGLG